MDRIAGSLRKGQLVFWEEVARDGAQAKTILTAAQRIEIARAHAEIFGENAPDHLVFAAGFISIGKDEVRAIQELADQVDTCYLAVNCRSSQAEIDLSLKAIKNAKYGRVAYVLPASKRLCELMLHKTQHEVLKQAVEIAKYAVDKANGVPVDVQLAASFDADPVFIAEAASALKEQGIAITHLGDTRGRIYPREAANHLDALLAKSDADQLYGVHFHNDMGFALDNNFEALKRGINLVASSWLGLGERNGLVKTELISLHTAYQPERIMGRLGFDGEKLYATPPNLKKIKPVADKVSEFTKVPLKVTDAVVGTGINSISTGTPFVDALSFQPFDPYEVLGISKKIYVTQLASKRVIMEVSKLMGYKLNDKQIAEILTQVKAKAYELERSIFPEDELHEIFTNVMM